MGRKGRRARGGASRGRGAGHGQFEGQSVFGGRSTYGGQNTYSVLANGGETGEMNADLRERFSSGRPQYADPERVPLARPTRMNDDIIQYFQDGKKAIADGGEWLSKPEIPPPSEILDPSGFDTEQIVDLKDELRPNKLEGAYADNQEYLSTQYDLLREDAIRPLREAVAEVRKDPWRDELEYPQSSGIGIYEPTYITSVVFSPRGLAARVAFSLGRVKKFIRWKQSKRLITGTLVALSPANDAFKSQCILATVAARPLSGLEAANPPEIDLFFARPQDFQLDTMRKWIMVECRSSFFEASRHTLSALQHMMHEPFPLSEHLVHAKKEIDPPAYVQDNPHTDMSSLVSLEEAEKFQNVHILEEWPAGDTHSLDKSQSKALKRILTNRLAIVQGPPGTGKTHVSVVALKILLANLRNDDPPIIVTCQTNHALDQLLLHVTEFEANFIRLGGRSKDQDKIKKRILFEVRQGMQQPRDPRSRKNVAMGRIKQLTKKMQDVLAPFEQGKGCLDHRLLVRIGLITETQAESLEFDAQFAMGIVQDTPGIQLEQWLGKSLVESRRPVQPDDFGMDYEEEDFDEVEQLEELEAEAVARDDDDIEALKGPVMSLSDNWTGRSGGSTSDEYIRKKLDETPDLGMIPPPERGGIYKYFQRKTKYHILGEFRNLAAQYDDAVLERKIGQWEQDQRLLAEQRLVGMTTTGLSKYRALIASLRPRIVLVEEAAETLEAPVTAACVPSLEHLILVGDHQQLRPHCQLHAFEDEPYYFNLSLFERMVINNIEFDTLTRQRRMIPEIRRLLYPIYRDTIKDHKSVTEIDNRPHVEGMGGCNSFFFTHSWPEQRDHNLSAFNNGEADMIVGLVNYLLLNEVDSRKITILTFYNGQRNVLNKRLAFHQNLRGRSFKVATVDSYQGEENDIVILSLVRSNKNRNIGFLSVDNRVCVALSRAKRGFYIFGNAEMLAIESRTWESVVRILWGHDKDLKDKKITLVGPTCRIGYHFPLQCAVHGNKVWIETPDDWELINGGCDQPCRCILPCGHTCMLKCHPFDKAMINCTQKCSKRVTTCGHPCVSMCCDPCKCMICDGRNKGAVSMLKPRQKHAAGAAASSSAQQAMKDIYPGPQTPFTVATTAMGTTATETAQNWDDFVNGGAKADDAKIYQRAKEQEVNLIDMMHNNAQPEASTRAGTLIEVTPKNKSPEPVSSKTMGQLIDLETEVLSPTKRFRHTETFSYAAAAAGTGSKKTENKASTFNLLD